MAQPTTDPPALTSWPSTTMTCSLLHRPTKTLDLRRSHETRQTHTWSLSAVFPVNKGWLQSVTSPPCWAGLGYSVRVRVCVWDWGGLGTETLQCTDKAQNYLSLGDTLISLRPVRLCSALCTDEVVQYERKWKRKAVPCCYSAMHQKAAHKK